MTTEHDEALVERVALAMVRTIQPHIPDDWDGYPSSRAEYTKQARAAIYPPAPPKTRLQVARELLAKGYEWRDNCENNPSYGPDRARNGCYDNNAEIHAILAALALPAMED